MKKKTTIAILISLALVITAGMALAQRQGQGRQRGNAPGAGMQQGRGGMQQGRPGMQPGRMGMRDAGQMQAMMSEGLRRRVGATEEQWKTIWPKLQKVMELTREVSGMGRGGMFAGGGRGGMGGGPGQMGGGFGGPEGQRGPRGSQAGARGPQAGTRGPQTDTARGPQAGAAREITAVEKATQELQQLLISETATADQIKTSLTALRRAKDKIKQDLAKAQTELKQGLSIKQEANLVVMGYLN